ncbi:MAG: Type II/IV secretion system ATP hydrolase TadA/VirB11/CpaF, TadA subfamily, partial [uncultured Acidimicrobiales bacterium]
PGRPRDRGRAGLPQPRRIRPTRAPPGRRRRLGDHGERPRSDSAGAGLHRSCAV